MCLGRSAPNGWDFGPPYLPVSVFYMPRGRKTSSPRLLQTVTQGHKFAFDVKDSRREHRPKPGETRTTEMQKTVTTKVQLQFVHQCIQSEAKEWLR
jgi:hypothetical protein